VDRLLRGINVDHTLRVVTAVVSDLVREGCRRHGLRGVEAVALGRALAAGCLMATLTKNDKERVRIAFDAAGPIGKLLVDAHGGGDVRGCLERRLDDAVLGPAVGGRTELATWIGTSGRLVVTRDLGLEHQYQGVFEVIDGEIDRDLERYLEGSEQLPSVLGCDVVLDNQGEVLRAAGVLCQSFPGAPPEVIEPIRRAVHGDGLTNLLAHERTTDELMGFALAGDAFEPLGEQALHFRCNCGPSRVFAVLSTLGADDLEQLATEPGDTEVRCSYCGTAYSVGPDELLDLAKRLREHRS
jgi:molecular chaperone Hsp33